MAYFIHIPASCSRELRSALDQNAILALRAYLRLVAELAETTGNADPVWARLDRDEEGSLRWFNAPVEVIFEVDRGHEAVVVREVRVPGTLRTG